MPDQIDMFSNPVPVPDNEDARIVFSVLKGRGWQHRDVLVRLLNDYFPWDLWDKDGKRLRDAANAAMGLIVSAPGSSGYIRVDECRISEGLDAIEPLRTQALNMLKKRKRIRQAVKLYGIKD